MKTIDYYFVPTSPWSYLGHTRLGEIAQENGASVVMKPMDLMKIFPISGGLPVNKRPAQRQAYRLEELERWQKIRNLPLNLQPEHFPTAVRQSLNLLAAAIATHGQEKSFGLAGDVLKATWADELDIADEDTLIQLATKHGMNGQELLNQTEQATIDIDANTEEAIKLKVFGAPWYRIDDQNYWGQDRLELIEQVLKA